MDHVGTCRRERSSRALWAKGKESECAAGTISRNSHGQRRVWSMINQPVTSWDIDYRRGTSDGCGQPTVAFEIAKIGQRFCP